MNTVWPIERASRPERLWRRGWTEACGHRTAIVAANRRRCGRLINGLHDAVQSSAGASARRKVSEPVQPYAFPSPKRTCGQREFGCARSTIPGKISIYYIAFTWIEARSTNTCRQRKVALLGFGCGAAAGQGLLKVAVESWRSQGARLVGLIEETHGLPGRTCNAGVCGTSLRASLTRFTWTSRNPARHATSMPPARAVLARLFSIKWINAILSC